MKPLPALFILALAAACGCAQGNDKDGLTIIYSASLNGNLDGCDCKDHPRAGLVRRAAWLRTLERPTRILLLDGGDLLDPHPDPQLATTLFDTYLELGYAAIALGDQEFANGIDALLEYRRGYPLMAHNLSICPDENRCIFFSTTPRIIERDGVRIGLFALIDPQVFTPYAPALKEKLKIQDPRTVARNQILYLNDEAPELTVVLYHGPSSSAEQLALGVAGIDILILAHEQLLIEPRRVADTILLSPGEEGNRVGVLALRFDESGAFEYSHRFRLFSRQDDPDDPAVRGRIDR